MIFVAIVAIVAERNIQLFSVPFFGCYRRSYSEGNGIVCYAIMLPVKTKNKIVQSCADTSVDPVFLYGENVFLCAVVIFVSSAVNRSIIGKIFWSKEKIFFRGHT